MLEVNQMNNVPFLWFTKAATWLTDIEEINNVLFGYNMSNFLISSKTTWCYETVNLFRIDKRLLFVFCTCTLNKWWYFRIKYGKQLKLTVAWLDMALYILIRGKNRRTSRKRYSYILYVPINFDSVTTLQDHDCAFH